MLVVLTEIIAPYRIPVFNALARQSGIDLHVVFLSENDPSLRQWRVYKDDIRFSYEVLPAWRQRLGKYNFLVNRGVGKALRMAAPDSVLCGGYSYLASWQAMRWCRRHRVPFYVWVESTLSDQRRRTALVESLKRRFLESASGFVVPGRSSAEYLASFGISTDIIFTAPNAVDVEFYSEKAAQARREAGAHRSALRLPDRYVLFVGRLVREKGVFDLLAAYGGLTAQTRSEVGLVFVGGGPAQAELQTRSARISPGIVQFPGFVHREELAIYYALSDMLIFPTYSDTWGLVVNEAMSCGLAIIATSAAGCTADLVRDGWNGRVMAAGNVAQLSEIMTELADNPEMCHKMGRHGRACIEGYTPEACAAGIATAIGRSRR